MKLLSRLLFILLLLAFTAALILVGVFITMPTGNSHDTHFDTLLVLGYPSKPDGSPTPEQRERVLEAVREFKSGIAPHIIVSGAAAHTPTVEADSMARLAISQGVPASAIVEETHAHDTLQNIVYSAQLMHQRGWSSAEIISSPSHLSRAAYIVNTLNIDQPTLSIDWRTHPAQWPPEYTIAQKLHLYFHESWLCVQLRIHGIPPARFPRELPTTSPSSAAAHSQSPKPN